jgi:hypothetical protein
MYAHVGCLVEAVASEEAEQPQETNGLVEAVALEEAE